MNKFLIAISGLLLAAVIFLFIKVFSIEPLVAETKEDVTDADTSQVTLPSAPETKRQADSAPTGKIVYVNIDQLNEQSLEIADLVAESKRRQNSIERSVEGLRERYQQKVEDFQRSQQAGIAPESELRAKAKEIENIEREAANKQMQMDDLTMDISEKNQKFQKTVRDFLQKWNQGRYDFILSYSETVPTMLLGNSNLEVTEEVIAELNREYKNRKNTGKK